MLKSFARIHKVKLADMYSNAIKYAFECSRKMELRVHIFMRDREKQSSKRKVAVWASVKIKSTNIKSYSHTTYNFIRFLLSASSVARFRLKISKQREGKKTQIFAFVPVHTWKIEKAIFPISIPWIYKNETRKLESVAHIAVKFSLA